MEIDLARAEAQIETVRSQVCVVGAGIAGLMVARKLARRGVDVALLEAGGRELEAEGQRLLETAELRGRAHVGTNEGRARLLGGTSLWWGGQVLGMSRGAAAGWPIAWRELERFTAEAEKMIEVDALPFEATDFFAATGEGEPAMFAELGEVNTRLSKWMKFSGRNLAGTLGREVIADAGARVYLHAQVTELLFAASGDRVEAVVAKNGEGKQFRFEAEQFVVAVGTVETSRLLLASRSVAAEGVGNAHGQVGRNFHDHVTMSVAGLTGAARARVLRELRPWVFGGDVHSAKLEGSRELCERLEMNPILAHVTIDEPEGSGIAVLRELLTASHSGELRRVLGARAGKIPGAGIEAVRLAWEAKMRRRRFVSDDAVVKLQVNVAQDVPSLSRILLGDDVDAMGVPRVVVDWRVSENEVGSLRKYARYLKERFEAMGMAGVEWVPEILMEDAELPGIEDARHAMGGACMGTDPRTSVVDAEMVVHGVGNLSIAGAATFPTGGAQLPTLTMMALALRVADRIKQGLGVRG
jgi:choline dehydrogenase-like flavoprotein